MITAEQSQDLLAEVHCQVRRCRPWTVGQYDELFSVGLVGAAEAAKAYCPQRGARIRTFAAYRIQGAIRDHLRSSSRRVAWAAMIPHPIGATRDPEPTRDWWDWLCQGLSRREALLLKCRYLAGLTMKDTARAIGISEARVSQMEAQLLRRLREKVDDHHPVVKGARP